MHGTVFFPVCFDTFVHPVITCAFCFITQNPPVPVNKEEAGIFFFNFTALLSASPHAV